MPYIDSLATPPKLIISLVPSQTELLFDLGLGEQVAGITKFCIHPAAAVQHKTKVGGTKNFRFDVIAQLQPDLIIGNKEENYQEGIEQLAALYPVWMSDMVDLPGALDMIQRVSDLTGVTASAATLSQSIKTSFQSLEVAASPKVAYFIWKEPYMVAGGQTFIHDMLCRCGFVNVFEHMPRYPEVTIESIRVAQPDFILLSSEPYPFKEKHITEFTEICPNARVRVVDGEMFCWYGSRLRYSVAYFQALIREMASSGSNR